MCVVEDTLVIAESVKFRGYLHFLFFLFFELLASPFKHVVIMLSEIILMI